MDFSEALKELKGCRKVARAGWNGKDMYLYMVVCGLPFPPLDEMHKWSSDSFPLSKFIVMKTADNKLIPWLASQTDILADDWQVIE